MPHPAQGPIYQAISSIRLIDPHTHINPHAPASKTLADLLGYHYYTELAHSAGMPKSEIEQEDLDPRELVRRLVSHLGPIENTAQYRWLIEICRTFFGFDGDRIDQSNWEAVYESAENQMRLAEWPQMVLDQSNVESVFLTNDFDDELTGFDTNTYIPCLRTDDLVFHLAKSQTRQRLEACTGIELDGSLVTLRDSLKQRFEHFVAAGARACAISLPPSFQPASIGDGRAANALVEVLRKGPLAADAHQAALSRRVFWTIAELCDEFGLPLDLMIGVNRGVYSTGVFQGQDLYDSRVSLIQYRELFNSFPHVKFPVSVLASVTNQELVSYAWIFPNVITNGHWWYSNTPSFIARDAAARLEAVPRTKQIAYYSDAYKLEFVWPKFDMYRQILAGILAENFVGQCGWSEDRAIELGQQVLRDNVDEIFPSVAAADRRPTVDTQAETWSEETPTVLDDPRTSGVDLAAAGSSAALAAGAIGTVEVDDPGNIDSSGDPSLQPAEGQQDEGEFSTIVDGDLFADPGQSPRSEPDEVLAQLEQSESELHDLPTVLELEDTVKIDDHSEESGFFDSEEVETIDEPRADPAAELDPVPSADEIQSVDLGDVELAQTDPMSAIPAVEAIDAEADPEPLDVGDILGSEPVTSQQTGSDAPEPSADVRMLRGETSFTPDEDTLQLHADPATGELTFPVSTNESEAASDSQAIPADTNAGEMVVDAPELVVDDNTADTKDELEETVDLSSQDFAEMIGEADQAPPPDVLTEVEEFDTGDLFDDDEDQR